ncbi:MAG: hypothetical protein NT066_07815, partial [Candidatus Omnitrophica bacterium]|nr:hypothetical protein [Candidatus Omnitrophota bacterium]
MIEIAYVLTSLVTAIGSAILGILVYFNNKKSHLNRVYLIMGLNISLWSFGLFICHIYSANPISLISNRLLHGAAAFIPVTYFHFILELLRKVKENKRILSVGYIVALILVILSPTQLFIKGMEPKLWFKLWPAPGVIYPFFLL